MRDNVNQSTAVEGGQVAQVTVEKGVTLGVTLRRFVVGIGGGGRQLVEGTGGVEVGGGEFVVSWEGALE